MDEDTRGRLAALEYVAALALNRAGTDNFASAWPTHIRAHCEAANAELVPTLPSESSKIAASEALDRIFKASEFGLRRQS